ncbi:XRE family transcriptional regulator [Fodinicurvata sp. EGI_FJ10296]|uniref:helix-turn-helix domain-containing protein n=1 Tax=Fodinicurvata sp. EGI_FJ10296 TaxID=3231908 RepID=UPI003456C8DF
MTNYPSTPYDRLQLARRKAGFRSANDAALAHGWTISTYRSHENGQRGMKLDAAERYARAYRVSAAWLLTGEGAVTSNSNENKSSGDQEIINEYLGISRVPIIGDAAPGVWCSVYDEGKVEYLHIPIVPNKPQPDFAVRSVGPGMNRSYSEGTILVCGNADGPLGPPRNGEHVVAERRDGDLVERRVAQYTIDGDGERKWLWPNSDHRDHQAPLPVDRDDLKIRGIVVAEYRPVLNRD